MDKTIPKTKQRKFSACKIQLRGQEGDRKGTGRGTGRGKGKVEITFGEEHKTNKWVKIELPL